MAVNWAGGVSGAASGAAAGAPFGPWGAGIGGAVGGVTGLLSGGGDQVKRQQLLSKQAERAMKDYFDNPISTNPLYKSGNDYIQNLLNNNPEAFKAFEAPYMQNFEQNIVPNIAEQFAGMGTGASGLSSSGLYNSLAQAGRGLQTDLAGMRGQMQLNALPHALAYAQQPYTNTVSGSGVGQYQPYIQAGQPSPFAEAGAAALKGFAQQSMNKPAAAPGGYTPQYSQTAPLDAAFRSGALSYT